MAVDPSGSGMEAVAPAETAARAVAVQAPMTGGGGRRWALGAGPRRRGTPGAAPRRRGAWWRSSSRPGESPRRFPGAGRCSGRHRGDAGASGRARRRVRRAPSVPYLTPVRSGAMAAARRPPPPLGRVTMLVPPSGSGKEPVALAETAAGAVGAGAHALAVGDANGRSRGSTTAWDATCSTPATRGMMVLVVASRRVPATVSWRRRVLGPAPRRCGGARSSTASGRARRRARRDAGGARRQARRDDDEGGSAWHAGDRGARRRATGTQEACCDATGRDGRRLRQVSCFFFRRHCSLTPLQLRYLAAKREARRRRGRLSAGQRRGGRLAVARMRGGGLSTAPRGPGRRQARQNWGGNGG